MLTLYNDATCQTCAASIAGELVTASTWGKIELGRPVHTTLLSLLEVALQAII